MLGFYILEPSLAIIMHAQHGKIFNTKQRERGGGERERGGGGGPEVS